jgi:hypothetical protein
MESFIKGKKEAYTIQPTNQAYMKKEFKFTKGSGVESSHSISNTSFSCNYSFARPISYKHNICFLFSHL